MLVKYKETIVNDIFDFVTKFNAKQEFARIAKVPIEKWEFERSDEEIINEILDKRMGKYIVAYNGMNSGFFSILELEKAEQV